MKDDYTSNSHRRTIRYAPNVGIDNDGSWIVYFLLDKSFPQTSIEPGDLDSLVQVVSPVEKSASPLHRQPIDLTEIFSDNVIDVATGQVLPQYGVELVVAPVDHVLPYVNINRLRSAQSRRHRGDVRVVVYLDGLD